MPRPRKWDDDAERRSVQNAIRKTLRAEHDTEFVGVDGEGIGRWRDHKYVLLGVADSQLENPAGLRYPEIFTHLYTHFLDHQKAAYVGFFLGYDFTQWFKTLSENRARYLWDPKYISRRKRTNSGGNSRPFPVH